MKQKFLILKDAIIPCAQKTRSQFRFIVLKLMAL